ncbi:MAG: response regulator transcription factor [Rhodoferax sp.]|nr:response regulator transcription factor [Rhodoferax sp.]
MPASLNIIVVEDHDVLREELVSFLARPNWGVRGVDSGEALDAALRTQPAHLVILDLNLPFEDGLSIARRLRASRPDMGIIMLTARTQPTERRLGYETGADVYLTKPANVHELESVVQNLGRRLAPVAGPGLVLRLGQLTLSGKAGHSLKLTRTEAQLLHYLCTAPERQVDTDFLIRKLSQDYAIDTSREKLTVLISRLRTKMDQSLGAGEGDMLKSVRGFGYQLMVSIAIE